MEHNPFRDYTGTFIQRVPKYGIKTKHGWITRNKALADPAVKAHLNHKYTVGGIAPWYPQFAIIDIDSREPSFVEDIRGELGLDENNSMLMASESVDSYHCILRPEVDGKPPTRFQLTKAFKTFANFKGIEIYPQANRVIRLPFGQFSKCLDYQYAGLTTWEDKLYWFQKLNEFDIGEVPGQQYEFIFTQQHDNRLPNLINPNGGGWYRQGAELLQRGLQGPSSRHDGQARVIYYLWRNNVPIDEAMAQTWAWIKAKHNGFSKDLLKFPRVVMEEIQRQATHIYTNYLWTNQYPDKCHNNVNGFICKPDVEDIVRITGASIPKSRFLFNVVKYSYPRRHRTFVPVHTDLLTSWGNERTYGKYINELSEKGVVKRGDAYSVGRFSKSLKVDWNFRSSTDAVLYEGRSVNTFEDTVKLLYEPDDFRSLLRGAGATRQAAYSALKTVMGSTG